MPDVAQGFPFKETCNPAEPEEAFLWMLVALPGQNGAPLILPVSYLRTISKRLWECGARPVESPTIKYRPPTGMEPHWMTAPGSWVPVDAPDPPMNPAAAALAKLNPAQRAEILRRLLEEERGTER